MTALFVVLFLGSLIYLSLSVNVKSYINIIGLQGIFLFGIAILELNELKLPHFLLILAETLLFKAIAVPVLLYRISKENKILNLKNNKNHRKAKGFNLVIITSVVIALSFLFSSYLDGQANHLKIKYFTAALTSVVMGMAFIIVNKNIIIHLISFVVIENGVFLLALAVGKGMPIMVNTAILLDLFVVVLALGIFINRIGSNFDHLETHQLSELKD